MDESNNMKLTSFVVISTTSTTTGKSSTTTITTTEKRKVSAQDTIQQLLRNENVESTTQDPKTHCFLLKQKDNNNNKKKKKTLPLKFVGSLKILKRTFYPRYKSPKVRRNENSSKRLGERIHRHVAHMVNCVSDGKCSCEIKTSSKRINKHAKRILDKLQNEMNIILVRAEVPILALSSKLVPFGTKIDLIGIRGKGTPLETSVIISLKTGYKKHFKRKPSSAHPNMEAPFKEWLDIPLNHHKLQLLTEYLICHHEYQCTFDEGIIIYGAKSKDDVHVETLEHPMRYQKQYDLMLENIHKKI